MAAWHLERHLEHASRNLSDQIDCQRCVVVEWSGVVVVVEWIGVVWCGIVVEWSGVVWCGVEWCGCGVEWSGVEWCSVVWCGVVW